MLDRLILTAEGDTPEGGGSTGGTTEPTPVATTPSSTPPWYAPAESLKTSNPEVWQTFENGVKSGAIKDLSTLIVKGISAEKKLGTALTMPNKDNPQELKSFKLKLAEAGILPSAPAKPEDYQVNLDAIPEALRSPELVGTVKNWAHKHGLSGEALTELMGIEAQRYSQTIEPALKYTQEQGQQAISDLAKELGKEPNVVEQWAGQWIAANLSEDDVASLEKIGAANAPALIKFAAKAGRDTGEDISVNADGTTPLSDTEFNDFVKTLSDPQHPNYQIYYRGDPESAERKALMEKREQLLKRKFGTQEVK